MHRISTDIHQDPNVLHNISSMYNHNNSALDSRKDRSIEGTFPNGVR